MGPGRLWRALHSRLARGSLHFQGHSPPWELDEHHRLVPQNAQIHSFAYNSEVSTLNPINDPFTFKKPQSETLHESPQKKPGYYDLILLLRLWTLWSVLFLPNSIQMHLLPLKLPCSFSAACPSLWDLWRSLPRGLEEPSTSLELPHEHLSGDHLYRCSVSLGWPNPVNTPF